MRRYAALATLVAFAPWLGACAHGSVPPPAPPPAVTQHPPLWLLRGAVIDADSGRPLGNASVSVLSQADSGATATHSGVATGADGRFMLDFTSPGDHTIRAAAIGHRFETVSVHIPAGGNVPYRVFKLSPLPTARDRAPSPTSNP